MRALPPLDFENRSPCCRRDYKFHILVCFPLSLYVVAYIDYDVLFPYLSLFIDHYHIISTCVFCFFLYVVDPTCSIRKTQDYVHFLIFSSLLVSRFVPVVSGLAVGHVVALVPVPAECWLCLRRRRCIGAC